MLKFFLLFFTTLLFGQNVPKDAISYDYFYKKEMQNIVRLKKEISGKQFDAIRQLEIADLYANINCEDSAYAAYFKAYEREKTKRTLTSDLFENLLFQLHRTESSKHNYSKDRRYFLNELETLAKKNKSDKWLAKIENEKFKDIFADSVDYPKAFEKIKIIQKSNFYKTDAEFQAVVLLNLGNLYTTLEKYDLAEKTLNQSLQIANKNNFSLQQMYALINLGVNERFRENYEKAKFYLSQTDTIVNDKYRIKISRIIAKQKQLVFEGLKDSIAAKTQEQLFIKLDSLINDFSKNSNFYEIDVKFQTKEKDSKINQLNNLENRFVRNKILYGFLIFVVFILAMYSFVRWKNSDRIKKKIQLEKQNIESQKQVLEFEHFNIAEELKTVKKLVIEDHLILKNNKKIYLTDLKYIKAEDHYLEVYTKTKKEVVRGTISEILKQLPPNFAQTHRSYIVNKNYIKTINTTEIALINGIVIPLTRKYKQLF